MVLVGYFRVDFLSLFRLVAVIEAVTACSLHRQERTAGHTYDIGHIAARLSAGQSRGQSGAALRTLKEFLITLWNP